MPVVRNRRGLFEEFLYRRGNKRPQPEDEAPPPLDPNRPVNLLLRFLGIALPLVVAYGLGLFYFGTHHGHAGFWVARALAAATWVAFTAALFRRGDQTGAVIVTVVYVFLVAWMWAASMN